MQFSFWRFPMSQPTITLDWIRSPECPWPPTVKVRAEEVMILSSEVSRLKHDMAGIGMMEAVKAGKMQQLAIVLFELSGAYRNLSKELVYFIATRTSTNYPE
jgi:hypothetical protein